MEARRGEPEQHVAFDDVVGRQQLAALGGADGKAGEVVVAVAVHAGHFGGLAADQRAAGLPAALGDAGDDRRALLGVELAGGEIVEEEQRLGALHDEVVDAHGDEVDADRVVLAGFDGDLELGADAVIGGDQHRIDEAGGLEVEQPAEAADLAVGARPPRRAHQRLDLLDHGVAGVDVDARLGIGEPVPSLLSHVLALASWSDPSGRRRSPGSLHEPAGAARHASAYRARPGRAQSRGARSVRDRRSGMLRRRAGLPI